LILNRTTTADASGATSTFVSDSRTYVSPAITLDIAAHLSPGGSTAYTLGLFAWLENAGHDARTSPNGNQTLGAAPLATPAYDLASGPQFYLGPYLGMQFGP
jgi:hypothetical protein